MTEANLIRAYYHSGGPQLTLDALFVDFEVDGDIYTHRIPNSGWSYQTPALAFLGYVKMKPSDADGSIFDLSGKTASVAKNKEGDYLLQQKVLMVGSKRLEQADWFDPDGEVWNGQGNARLVGVEPDSGTGNRAGVPVDGEE